MKKLIIVLLVIILVPVLVLGYLGFVPGLSTVMGTNKPRDLGVRYTEADLKSVMAKNGMTIVNLPQDSPVWVRYEGRRELKNVLFTQEEITARMNNAADNYKYAGVHDLQTRFNDDGTVEVSGKADFDMMKYRAEDISKKFGISDDAKKAGEDFMKAASPLNSEPPFYMKGTLSVTNNKINMDVEKAEIGRVPIPVDQVPTDGVTRIFEQAVNEVPGLSVRSLTFENGEMKFDGTIPQKTYQIPPQ